MFHDFYGLTGKPFQLTPDPAFYFRSVTHRKALSYLGYGLAQGEGFIVITGEVGAGKSTLVAHLMSTLDPQRLTVGQIVTSKLDEEEIVHVVAQSFGLEVEGRMTGATEGRIAGAPVADEPMLFKPAARDVHIGTGTEPDEEAVHAFGQKQIDHVRHAARRHARFSTAHIDTIEIRRRERRLAVGIDGDVAIAERAAAELTPNQGWGLAPAIHPLSEPPHSPGQIDRVGDHAPCL